MDHVLGFESEQLISDSGQPVISVDKWWTTAETCSERRAFFPETAERNALSEACTMRTGDGG